MRFFSGINDHLADNDLQEFINKKTNRPVVFGVEKPWVSKGTPVWM